MSLLETTEKLNSIIDKWKEINRRGGPPIDILKKLASFLEVETTNYLLLDPDPFDDRFQGRTESESVMGHLLKTLYSNEDFMAKLCTSYIFNSQTDFELNCQAARILLIMQPIMRGEDIFQDVESHVSKLLDWAKDGKEPLRSYSCGLLLKAMQMSECPGLFKDKNAILVPIVIKRLKILSEIQDLNTPCIEDFQNIDKSLTRHNKSMKRKYERKESIDGTTSCVNKTPGSASRKRRHPLSSISKKKFEYSKPNVALGELNVGLQQKLLLKYLYPMGEYQELLPYAFELKVIDLIYHYINPKMQCDPHLACAALFYLSSLLCHKKFIVEFVSHGGIQRLLEIPQPSIVATLSSLCLYYMAFNEDSMERVCLLPQNTLHNLIEYLLWLLECSHISGRCHSSLFFSMTFSFRAVLNLFDSMDGLRKLINMIATLKILCIEESMLSTDEDVFLDREMVKNACLTLKKYYEAHVLYLADNAKRSHARDSGSLLPPPIPAYKSIVTANSDEIQDKIMYTKSLRREIGTTESQIIKKTKNLNVATILFQVIALASEWKNYNSRSEVIISALEALSALSISKKMLLIFCQQVEVAPNETQTGIQIILRAVEGDLMQDIQVQKAALDLLCNCVTMKSIEGEEQFVPFSELTKPQQEKVKELYVMKKLWSIVRLNNGIKILLTLLNIKTPITNADAIRSLVCKALCGLSGDTFICQVLSKLPTFHNEQLQLLMREPILSDRMSEHVTFCKYASQLIEKVTGKSIQYEQLDSIPTISRLTKADIISQTKITYPQKELLQIIHNHLIEQGLERAAESLQVEANLPFKIKELPSLTPLSSFKDHLTSSRLNQASTPSRVNGSTPLKQLAYRKSSIPLPSPFASPQFDKRTLFTPKSKVNGSSATPSSPMCSAIERFKKDQIFREELPFSRDKNAPTLDNIVTSYLREQHAHCANPVAICPPFSLMRPHHCPEPRYRSHASTNMAERMMNRQINAPHGGMKGRKQNRRYIYSKYRSTGCIKESEDDCIFTSCAWLPESDCICLGTQTGDIKVVNFYGQEESLQSCHGAPISTCSVSRNGKLMTTSASYGLPLGAVWSLNRSNDQPISFELKLELPDDYFVQFSHSQDRVVGTDDITAHIYDLTSGQLIRAFYDEKNTNHYSKNYATFSPGDELLLNDGCLWDIRGKKMIHKFDKFNDYVSGVFHPSGLEIIINSEVWDIRTYHLLDTCPALDQSRIVFSNNGDVILGVKHIANPRDMVIEHSGMLGPFDSSFRTFDAYDYSAIATVDVKKTIFDIAPNRDDEVLAIIENVGNMSTLDLDTTCRFYDIGRTRRTGEEDSEEEQEDESEDHSNGSNRALDDDVAQLFNNIFANEDDDDDNDDEDDDEVDFDDDDDDATVDFDEDDVNSFSNDDTTNDGSWESVDSDV